MPVHRTPSSLHHGRNHSRSTLQTPTTNLNTGRYRSSSSESSPCKIVPVPQHYRTTALKFASLKSRLRIVDEQAGTIPSYNIHNGDIEPLAYPKWSRASGPVEPVSNLLRDFYNHNEDQWPACFHGLKVRIIDVKSGINAGMCCAVCGCNPGDEDCNFWVIFDKKVPADPLHFETDSGDSTSQFRSFPTSDARNGQLRSESSCYPIRDPESIFSDSTRWSGDECNSDLSSPTRTQTSESQSSGCESTSSSLDEVNTLLNNVDTTTERVVCNLSPVFEGGPRFFITETNTISPPQIESGRAAAGASAHTRDTFDTPQALPLPTEGTSGYNVAFHAWTPPPASLGTVLPGVSEFHYPAITPTSHPDDWRAAVVDLATTRGIHLDTFWKLWGVCARCSHVVSSSAWEAHYNTANCVEIIQGTVPGVSGYYM